MEEHRLWVNIGALVLHLKDFSRIFIYLTRSILESSQTGLYPFSSAVKREEDPGDEVGVDSNHSVTKLRKHRRQS